MPVLANFEVIWVVIIVISVIAQIVKGLKKVAAQQAQVTQPAARPQRLPSPPPVALPIMPRAEPPAPLKTEDVAPAVTLEEMPHKQVGNAFILLEIKQGLRDRNSIRKAVIMREILGPPLALR